MTFALSSRSFFASLVVVALGGCVGAPPADAPIVATGWFQIRMEDGTTHRRELDHVRLDADDPDAPVTGSCEYFVEVSEPPRNTEGTLIVQFHDELSELGELRFYPATMQGVAQAWVRDVRYITQPPNCRAWDAETEDGAALVFRAMECDVYDDPTLREHAIIDAEITVTGCPLVSPR